MKKMTNSTIGLDVSKDHLDAHRLPDGGAKQFPDDAAGHKALIRWVKATPTYRIVFEATGPYSRAMEPALTGAGLPAVKVNPRQARRFAEALGTRSPKPMRSTPPCWPGWAKRRSCPRDRRKA
jgi:transposase